MAPSAIATTPDRQPPLPSHSRRLPPFPDPSVRSNRQDSRDRDNRYSFPGRSGPKMRRRSGRAKRASWAIN